jgi:hypothetical protein
VKPTVPAVPAPVYRGVMGKEPVTLPCWRPFVIPTPEEVGVVPTGTARLETGSPQRVAVQRTPLVIPTPEELGVVSKR